MDNDTSTSEEILPSSDDERERTPSVSEWLDRTSTVHNLLPRPSQEQMPVFHSSHHRQNIDNGSNIPQANLAVEVPKNDKCCGFDVGRLPLEGLFKPSSGWWMCFQLSILILIFCGLALQFLHPHFVPCWFPFTSKLEQEEGITVASDALVQSNDFMPTGCIDTPQVKIKPKEDLISPTKEIQQASLLEKPSVQPNEIKESTCSCDCEKINEDETGMADLALESLGGLIVGTRDTEEIPSRNQIKIFGIPIWASRPIPPETIIRYGIHPGICWAFKGNKGNVIVQIVKPALITGVHLQHIHKNLDPYGTLTNAPKEFTIWGIKSSRCITQAPRILLGNFTFTPLRCPLQFFPIKSDEVFPMVELEIRSNYGAESTCIYRFRVHGIIN